MQTHVRFVFCLIFCKIILSLDYKTSTLLLSFLINDLANQFELEIFSLEQLAINYYVPIKIMKIKFNNIDNY